MSKYAIALILPLSFLAAFNIFSMELAPKRYTERQYQLDTGRATLATNEDEGPVIPGEGRTETSTNPT